MPTWRPHFAALEGVCQQVLTQTVGALQNQAEQQLQETQSRAQLEAGKLQDQMRDLKMQNQRLHEELDRAAGQSATAAADAAGETSSWDSTRAWP